MTSTTVGAGTRRPRVSRDFLEFHRRRRLVDAAAEILHEFGARGLTVNNVVQVSGTARTSFYGVFGGIDDLLAYGTVVATKELFAGVDERRSESGWLDEVDTAIANFYGRIAAEPLLAELLLVHAPTSRTVAGPDDFWSAGAGFVPLLRRGEACSALAGLRPPSATIAECLSRAIVALAANRIGHRRVKTLPREARAMALLAGGYYLGPEVGDRELAAAKSARPDTATG